MGMSIFFVLNANRPETDNEEKAILFMEEIAFRSGLRMSGIVNTTHMLKETTVEDVMKGQELCEKVSKKTGVPVRYTVALEEVTKRLPREVKGEVLPIRLFMREEWML